MSEIFSNENQNNTQSINQSIWSYVSFRTSSNVKTSLVYSGRFIVALVTVKTKWTTLYTCISFINYVIFNRHLPACMLSRVFAVWHQDLGQICIDDFSKKIVYSINRYLLRSHLSITFFSSNVHYLCRFRGKDKALKLTVANPFIYYYQASIVNTSLLKKFKSVFKLKYNLHIIKLQYQDNKKLI